MKYISNSVNRSRAYENTIQALGGQNQNPRLFPTLREALSFAAVLGYRERRRRKLDDKAGKEDIQSSVYNGNEAIDLIFAIALAEEKTTEILKPENEKQCIQIFEEYANGGLSIITEWIDRYADIDIEDAIWRGLKSIGFKPDHQEATDQPTKIDF